MTKQIKVEGRPAMVSSFYGSVNEGFKAGDELMVQSTNGWQCLKRIRKVFDRGNGSCLVDLL